MTAPKYLTGRPTNGDRLQARYDAVHGDHSTFMDRNSVRLIALCIVGLGAIGAASWGMPKLFEAINSYVEYSVD